MANFKDIMYIKPPAKEGGKSFWMNIGRAWVNKDGSLNLKFDVVPVSMDNIQVRDHIDREKSGETFED